MYVCSCDGAREINARLPGAFMIRGIVSHIP